MQATQSSRLQNPNPNPQIFTPNHNHNPFFFDFSDSNNPPSIKHHHQQHQQQEQEQEQQFVDLEKMNSINVGSGGSGGLDYGFASPSVSQSAYEKSGLRSGRSMPRFTKVRKHGSSFSQKGKSGALSGSSDFTNTFRSDSEDCSNRVDEGGIMEDLRDQCQSWKPFSSSDSGEKIDGLSGFDSSVSGNFEFGKSNGSGGFVFGANSSSSLSNSRASVGVSLPQEMQKLKIGKEVEDQSERGVGERVSSSFNDVGEKGGFVFGSRSDKNPSLGGASESSKLGEDLRKLNIQTPQSCDGLKKNVDANLGSETNVGRTFVSRGSDNVASSMDGNEDSKLHDEMKSLNVNEYGKSGGFDKTEDSKVNLKDGFITFVFGSRKKNNDDFSGGSTAANKLPDKLKNLNIKDFRNSDGVEKTEDANFKVNEKSPFIFGSDKKNAGYADGMNVNKVASKINKLHIGSKVVDSGSRNSDEVEKTQDANFKINEKNNLVFGSDKYHAGCFVDSNVNELPNKIEKLNIGSKIGDSSGCAAEASSSSSSSSSCFRISSEDRDLGNSTDNVFNTSATPTTFQAASFGGASVQSNENPRPVAASASSHSSSSGGTTFDSVGEEFEATSTEGAGQKDDSFSTNTVDQFFTCHMSFCTPKQDPSSSSNGNLYTSLNQKSGFSAKRGPINRTKCKNRKAKLRQPAPAHQWATQNYTSKGNNHQENQESPGHYSPMDFSPYEETLAAEQSSRETSVASEDHFNLDGNSFRPSVPGDETDEDLVSATHSVDIDEVDLKSGELNGKGFGGHFERHAGSTCSFEESFSGVGLENLTSSNEEVANGNDTGIAAAETEFGFHQNMEGQENDSKTQFCSASISEDVSATNFTFAASSSSQGHFSAAKRHFRRKYRMKVGYDSSGPSNVKQQFDSSSGQFFPFASSSLHFGNVQSQKGDSSSCHTVGEKNSETDKDSEFKQQSVLRDTGIPAFQEACEKCRLRGNQAYAAGDLSKAEEYYTEGVNCVFRNDMSKSCSRALMLCYSNRAVVRMAAGRMREALGDCRKAIKIDNEFLKAQVRAANCHLALGEVEEAIGYFKKILPSGDVVCLDRKTVIEASTGLQKAQQMANYLASCTELLRQKTCKDADRALKIIAEALLISPYSEKLLQMKAEALLVLRKHSELIQLCEQSLEFAEKNSASVSGDGQREKLNGSESIKISSARLWRWFMISKSYFYLGKLEEALEFLEQAVSVAQKYESSTLESSIALAVTIRELLRYKTAGNEAFQSGRHSEAVEHYTSAISCNIESRPFAAICFCNRAAAYQALGQITDAIADCSLAIALDGNYPKAISRRATLHEMIRDFGQAVNDLRKLIFLLEKQTAKANSSGTVSRSTSCANDLKQACTRLSAVEEEARKGTPLNMYLILGVEPSGTASEIKKAYRKAALRHHPDKAGQFLARSENGDDGLWKDIAEEVHKDADRLFKMIGEAYAVLTDLAKRSRYDLEEESRNALKKGNGCCSQATPSDAYGYQHERSSSSRHHWHDVRRSYWNQSEWSEAHRSNRYS